MDILLAKANINEPELKSYIIRVSADEMGKLSEPCYYPKIQKHFYQLLNLTGLTEKDLKEHIAEFYRGSKQAALRLHRDTHTNLVIFIAYYFLKKRDMQTYLSSLLWHSLKEYSRLMHHRLRYCNNGVFTYTLEHLSKTHLFVREKSIAGALFFITQQMQNIYTDIILTKNADEIAGFITACRTRIRQSITSFQILYYKYQKEGVKYRAPYTSEEGEEYEYQTLEKRTQLVDSITKSIVVYKEIDEKALAEAKSLTKVRETLATLIVQELSNVTYQENVKSIVDLFVRDVNSVSIICGKEFFKYVRILMAIKRTTRPVYFKQQVNELLIKILKATKTFSNYSKLTPQSQSLVTSFLAFYITMFVRNKIC